MSDLKYFDGTNWITLKGAGVELSQSVNVDTTGCDIGPADSTGSLTKDGAEVDGVQTYKLDLTLPRPPVVTTSESEPTGGCDGDFWVDESEAGAGSPSVDEKQLARAFVCFSPTNSMLKTSSYNVSTVAYNSPGLYTINFERPMADDNFCPIATADVKLAVQTNAVTAITRLATTNKDSVECRTAFATSGLLADPETVKVVVFNDN